MADIFDSVRTLKGVGEARARQLRLLGLDTLYDLISYYPRSYEDRSRMCHIAELEVDVPACFSAMVVSAPRLSRIRAGLELTQVRVADDTAALNLVFFNRSYVREQLHYGETYYFYGTVTGDYVGYQMANPVVESQDSPGVATRRIVPVYRLTAGLSNALISKTVQRALDACRGALPEVLPDEVREQYGLCGVQEAYDIIHDPPEFEALAMAKRRLIFEEFFIFSAGLSQLRQKKLPRPALRPVNLAPFWAALPFAPTAAQMRAVGEISTDLQKPAPMTRLLQGDVGSGKTMVAAAAIYLAAKGGLQCALMAPTEILAAQHFASLQPLFERLGISSVLLTGSANAARRREAFAAMETGRAQLAVGTQALLSDAARFQALGLVIADEQHRFGVEQRALLAKKGERPHMLVMSATPIPRTLALILYGDLDISTLDELPPGRQTVDTFLVSEALRPRINKFLRKQAAEGHQSYIICPAVEESELDSLKSAESWAATLQETVFPDLRVGLLHGRMSGQQKEAVMGAFAAGDCDLLVATTVVEVGMDVPNATLIVIENADRFGLAELHQLRGRVGRGKAKSYCILISSNRSPEARARLEALCRTNDGFQIAREDLNQRGPGDLFGSRQHGLPLFKTASLEPDLSTLEQARTAAADFLARPDAARSPCYAPLCARIPALLSQETDIFN